MEYGKNNGGGDLVDREIVASKDDHDLISSNCGHVSLHGKEE